MRRDLESIVRRLRTDESGSVIVMVAISIAALLTLVALAIDTGKVMLVRTTLQASTDQAAYAGALLIPQGTAKAIQNAQYYSAVAAYKGPNANLNLAVTMTTNFYCASPATYQLPTCVGPTPYNTIVVKQTATIPLDFGSLFSFNSIQISTTSTASIRNGALPPLNAIIIVDTTQSMKSPDPNGNATTCGIANPTQIQCALFGVKLFLGELWPTLDSVGLMVFPPLNTNTANGGAPAKNDYDCSASTVPVDEAYSLASPANYTTNYQVVALSSDYKTSDTGPLNDSSNLVTAAQGPANCAGITVPQTGQGTYFAGAITAAQNALTASSEPGRQNVIMLLSDGGAGNASTLGNVETSAETPVGSSILTFASGAVPASVIPGTSVSDTTTSPNDTTVIPASTTVVSTNGITVTISNPVVAVATATTNKATAAGSVTLNFASVPAAVQATPGGVGLTVADKTNPSVIPTGTTVVSATATTVTISKAVTGTTSATDVTNAATAAGLTTLHFASVPATVKSGMAVADTTAASAIPASTTVVSTTVNTVTISNPVADTTTVTDTTNQSSRRGTTTKTLNFASVPATVKTGMTVTGSGIPAGTTVSSTTLTTVVISVAVTETSGDVITFSGGGVASGDTITFSSGGVASGDFFNFGDVKDADTISFGSINQCQEAIAAAKDAALAGTWVYSIAYGSSTASNSCSDKESPAVTACQTMQQIASDPTKFYSDATAGCTSPDNPASAISSIFAAIGYSFKYTTLLANGYGGT